MVSRAAAEDLASETWLGVVRGLDRFEGNEAAFRAWVFTIARHEVLDWRRRVARRPAGDLPANALAEWAAPDDPAADAVEGFSTRAALAMVATLPADQAEAIVLRVVAGLGVDRVAAIMGKRPGTVRVLVGGLCGLAWTAGLRGFMAQVAGPESGVDWAGTFGWILIPGIAVGGLLGWAEHLRSSGGRREWRWLALAPLLFWPSCSADPRPAVDLRGRGGGGAIGVSLYGLLGGTRCRTEDQAGPGSPAAPWP